MTQRSMQDMAAADGTRVVRVEHTVLDENGEAPAAAMDRDQQPATTASKPTPATSTPSATSSATSVLEQELWAEVLALNDEERAERFRQANTALQTILELPSSERVRYLTTGLDATAQRSMAMKRLWDTMRLSNSPSPGGERVENTDYTMLSK